MAQGSSPLPRSGLSAQYQAQLARATTSLMRAGELAQALRLYSDVDAIEELQMELHSVFVQAGLPRPLRHRSALIDAARARAAVDACVSQSEPPF